MIIPFTIPGLFKTEEGLLETYLFPVETEYIGQLDYFLNTSWDYESTWRKNTVRI